MTDPQRSAESIFHEARAIASPDERARFLDRACAGDDALRAEVESLLSALDEAGSYLSRPEDMVTALSTPERTGEDIPEHIGRYHVLQRIGEGGFGEVYEAEQREPVRRRVALKILKPGLDSRAILARFDAERQALAVMDHACIAKVFDGGATERGLPYFVMELVRGSPITQFCDANRLSVDDRLRLFARVCDAVQHAHTKGIIHRDLKPSNILVAYDGDGNPQPKVIDFGVAKAINQPLSQRTIFTERGQLLGTPEYMSPEQASLGAIDVDTRTDVYSLGVVLYELLTGALPFDSRTLRAAGFDEIRRVIREVDPPKPSTRLFTILSSPDPEARSRLASTRRADPRTLSSVLRRDLDWVVMRCLEKDRARRYAAASDLAQEIHRYLRREPVAAGPPSRAYRLAKFVRRNRAPVAAGSVIAISLIGGLAATTLSLLHALEANRRALAEADLSTSIAAFLADDLFAAVSPRVMGPDVLVRDVLDAASSDIEDRFRDAPLAGAGIRDALGRSYQSIGVIPPAIGHARAAYESFLALRGPDDPRTVRAAALYASLLRRDRRADEAIGVLDTVAAGSPEHSLELANCLRWTGRRDEAAILYRRLYERALREHGERSREAIILAYDLALNDEERAAPSAPGAAPTDAQRRTLEEAQGWYERALSAARAALPPDDPLTLSVVSEFARFLSTKRSDAAAAEPLYREGLQRAVRVLGEDHWRTRQTRANLGRFYARNGRPDDGLPHLLASLEVYTTTDSERTRQGAPTILLWTLEALRDAGRADEAAEVARRAIRSAEQTFGPDDPSTQRCRDTLLEFEAAPAD